MKIKFCTFLLAIFLAMGMLSVSTSVDAGNPYRNVYDYGNRGNGYYPVYSPHRVEGHPRYRYQHACRYRNNGYCGAHYYKPSRYYRCRWVEGYRAYGNWYPARKVCWR